MASGQGRKHQPPGLDRGCPAHSPLSWGPGFSSMGLKARRAGRAAAQFPHDLLPVSAGIGAAFQVLPGDLAAVLAAPGQARVGVFACGVGAGTGLDGHHHGGGAGRLNLLAAFASVHLLQPGVRAGLHPGGGAKGRGPRLGNRSGQGQLHSGSWSQVTCVGLGVGVPGGVGSPWKGRVPASRGSLAASAGWGTSICCAFRHLPVTCPRAKFRGWTLSGGNASGQGRSRPGSGAWRLLRTRPSQGHHPAVAG